MKNVLTRANAMRRVCVGTFLLFFAAFPSISLGETTINFDDLAVPVSPGWIELPPSYEGLEWSPIWEVEDESFFQSVYYNTYSFPSGSNAASNGGGVESVAVASSSPFVLNSLWVSTWAAYNNFYRYSSRTLTIEGYYGDILVGSSTFNLSANKFDFWEPGITSPINRLVFKSDGDNRWWLMDDLSITPAEQAVVETLVETEETIRLIPPENLHNDNAIEPLSRKIQATLKMMYEGLYEDALDKLQNDILKKTDGCAETDAPDATDWILTCEDQAKVYPLVMRAIELLQRLVE